MREENRAKWVITTLIVIIVILLGFVVYFSWLKPSYEGLIFSKQQEAYNIGINDTQRAILGGIRTSLTQTGYLQITFEDNQTVYLRPFDPATLNQQAPPEGIVPTA